MRSVKSLVAAGAASLLSSMAFAADMTIAPPPMYVPPPVEDFGGWYLRGDIGFSNQRVKRLNNALDATNTSSDWLRLTGDDQRRIEVSDGVVRCVGFCWRR
jgi:opacity protein-like surface antigen